MRTILSSKAWHLGYALLILLLGLGIVPQAFGKNYPLKTVQRIEKGTIYFQEPTTNEQYILHFERGKSYTLIFPNGQKEVLSQSMFDTVVGEYDLAIKVAPNKKTSGTAFFLDKNQNMDFHHQGHHFKLPGTILADLWALYSNNGDLESLSFGFDTDKGIHFSINEWISFPVFFLMIFAFLAFYVWRMRKKYQLKLAVSEAKLEASMAREEIEKVRADSRKWLFDQQEQYLRELGQGIHDDHLNNLKNVMRLVQNLMGNEQSFSVQHDLQEIRHALSNVADKLHNVSETLFPRWVKDFNLQGALEVFIEEEYKKQYTQIEVLNHLENDRKCLGESERFQLYRVFQEAMHNAAIHGKATQVRVFLQKDADYLSGKIEDNGRGFKVPSSIEASAKESKRLGLLGIQERIYMLNGSIEWHSEIGKGTSVSFKIPITKTS